MLSLEEALRFPYTASQLLQTLQEIRVFHSDIDLLLAGYACLEIPFLPLSDARNPQHYDRVDVAKKIVHFSGSPCFHSHHQTYGGSDQILRFYHGKENGERMWFYEIYYSNPTSRQSGIGGLTSQDVFHLLLQHEQTIVHETGFLMLNTSGMYQIAPKKLVITSSLDVWHKSAHLNRVFLEQRHRLHLLLAVLRTSPE